MICNRLMHVNLLRPCSINWPAVGQVGLTIEYEPSLLIMLYGAGRPF
jgi:hypothetical protein